VFDCVLAQSEWRLCLQYGPQLVFKGELIMSLVYDESIGDWWQPGSVGNVVGRINKVN